MNQQMHRLVFSCRLGMLVAVAENARSSGKTAGGERRSAAGSLDRGAVAALLVTAAIAFGLPGQVALAQTRPAVVFASKLPASATNLPQKHGSGSTNATPRPFAYDPAKGSGSADLSTAGQVGWSVSGTTGTFDQGSVERVVVNWDTFNIGPGFKVHFKQDTDPAKYVSALNRIWSADPTQIFGSLTADREVILLNANGVYFGRGARVDTGKFVATSLSIADSVFEKGLRNITDGSAVFSTTGTNYLPTNLDSGVTVEAGAELRSAAGGDVLLLAPRVVNQGRIETPKGQAVLAAGDKVYLMSSSDPKQRGLIVAVDPVKVNGTNDAELGIAENAASGSYKTVGGATVADITPDNTSGLVSRLNEMRAESGTVNLVGLTVRQSGQINATTAVKGANGAIYLQAMASTTPLLGGNEATAPAKQRGLLVETGAQARVGLDLGTVLIGAGSVTAVRPSTDGQTQIDAEAFNPSRILVEGASIIVAGGAQLLAPAGRIDLLAANNSFQRPAFDNSVGDVPSAADSSRIVIGSGATISTAGLRGVAVDGARNQGNARLFRIELADAPVQRSGPLYRNQVFFDLRDLGKADKLTAANVAGAANGVARTVQERAAAGGNIRLESEGSLVLAPQATLDVSGGSLDYSAAAIKNTLVTQDGRSVTFANAAGGNQISKLLDATHSTPSPAYAEGKAGGSLVLNARRAVVAGELQGSVVEGPYQRDGRASRAAPSSLSVGRQLNNRFYLDGLRLVAAGATAPDAAVLADPLNASLAALPSATELSLASVQQGGFGKLNLRAVRVNQPAYASLNLGVGGGLDLAAGAVDLNGSFAAPGGSISVASVIATDSSGANASGDIHLSGATRLSAAGLWTNDTAATAGASPTSVQTKAGTLAVRAANSLQADAGAAVDVSAGAQLRANGSLALGTAGSMTVGGGTAQPGSNSFSVGLAGVALTGFDFAAGGSLRLDVPTLTITDGATSRFALAPDFFSAGGFGNISVNTGGDVLLPTGTVLAPRLRTWMLDVDYRRSVATTLTNGPATARTVDSTLAERKPVNLSFAATRDLSQGGGTVVVERGASISLEHGGSLTMRGTGSVLIGTSGALDMRAQLSAPGGSITLALDGLRGGPTGPADDPNGFRADQAIWLGSGADLSVAGVATLRDEPPATGVFFHPGSSRATATSKRVTGSVLGGGTIALAASRGYVVAQAGSSMNLDWNVKAGGPIPQVNLPGLANAVTLARPAGSLSISSPEGFAVEGSISAKAPLRDRDGKALADGGRLSLNVGGGGVRNATNGAVYPDATGGKPRTIAVGNHANKLSAAAPGVDLTTLLDNGVGYTPLALLSGAGFDGLKFYAGEQLRFDSSVALNKPLGIEVQSPLIVGRAGVQVDLSGSHIVIGDTSSRVSVTTTAATRDASANGSTTLRLGAPEIDIYNQSGFGGFTSVKLDGGERRDSEVRLSGANQFANDFGQLNFAGRLEISAGQTYATSGNRFNVVGLEALSAQDAGSQLVLRAPSGGGTSRTPLSAFGTFTASATTIEQGGILRQPFGQLSLTAARQLILSPGSVTSVAADGATIPYGLTENLSRWIVKGFDTTALPTAKAITITAPYIQAAAGATVSARGGGEVTAFEFFPGVGGSSDYYTTAGLYAVLPDYASTRALSYGGGVPTDGSGSQQIVITMGAVGLPPGRYTLLPARFALLNDKLPQGAFLVSRAPDQGKTVLQKALQRDDGSAVVTGYLSEAGSATVGAPGERFVIEPQSTYAARADVRSTGISDLLSGRAQARGAALASALPRDAGRVELNMTGTASAAFASRIELHADGGQAGVLDVSSLRLALVDTLAKTPAGALGIAAASIGDSGAGSVLLGGKRTALAPSATVAVNTWSIDDSGTQAVTVDIGATPLKVEELLLAASNSVTLADNTAITGTATGTLGARTLQSNGDGAFLAIGANALQVLRSGPSLQQGNLVLGAGVTLSAPQLALDATGRNSIAPGARLSGQALSLAAPTLVVGTTAGPAPQATVLDGPVLADVLRFDQISLRSYASIDFAGTQDWAQRPVATQSTPDPAPTQVLQRLVLDAPQVRSVTRVDGNGQSTAGATDIAARSVTIQNTSGLVSTPAQDGYGGLRLEARPAPSLNPLDGLLVGPGVVALGASDARLQSSTDIVLQGNGGLAAVGNLTLSSARVTATSAAVQSLSADNGILTIASAAGTTPDRDAGSVGRGASVRLSGQRVLQQGMLALASGQLTIDTKDTPSGVPAVRFEAGSVTDLSGAVRTGSDGSEAYAKGGDITVQAAGGRIDVLGVLDVGSARLQGGSRAGDAGSIALRAAGLSGSVAFSGTAAGRQAVTGTLLGAGGTGATDLGGSLVLDVIQAANLDNLAQQASAGGFTQSLAARVRQGDVALAGNLRAQRITLGADAGKLEVAGTLDARAATGGVVQLAAGGDVVLQAGASIDARSTRTGANGGDVQLSSSTGVVRVVSSARIDTSGDSADDGRIVLRALRNGNSAVNVTALNTANLLAAEVDVEAVRVYSSVTSGVETRNITSINTGTSRLTGSGNNRTGVLGQTTVNNDSTSFMASAAAILDNLGVAAPERSRVLLRAGVEVRASADLAVTSDWALNASRPGGDAGFLTLRANGNLNINGSISDGFSNALPSATLNGNPRSWSYRFAAGSDLTAANPLMTNDLSGTSTESGNLRIAAGKLVRTGAGSIDLVAGRDVLFAPGSGNTPAGLAYVAGRAVADQGTLNTTLFARQSAKPIFSQGGGRIEVAAQRDVFAPEATQLVNNWFWRSGLASSAVGEPDLYSATSQLAWWTQFNRFNQTLGSFGGGDMRVTAGRDAVNLQAMVPSQAYSDSRNRTSGVLNVFNGGDLTVSAGRDVVGGQFLVGRGEGRVDAGRDIAEAAGNTTLVAPIFGLMDGNWELQARRDLQTAGSFNPTLVAAPRADNRLNTSGVFATFGLNSAFTAKSTAGNVGLTGYDASTSLYGVDNSIGAPLYQVSAPNLALTALNGSIGLFDSASGSVALFPSTSGQLSLWAGGDLRLGGTVAMADTALDQWPGFRNPASAPGGGAGLVTPTLVSSVLTDGATNAALHVGDPAPASVYAGGSINTLGLAALSLPKAATLIAGGDISNLRLTGQNLDASDVTRITAGGNFLAGQQGYVRVAGPGLLQVVAGRQVDLDASGGLVTTGNLRNAKLPAGGASIGLQAAAAGQLNLEAFNASYLQEGGGNPRARQYRDLLVATVQAALRQANLDYHQAWAYFQNFPVVTQAAFGRQVLAAEFGAVYLAASPPTGVQMTESLRVAFERDKAQILQAGNAALAAGGALTLPGREVRSGAALASYLGEIGGLAFTGLNLDSTVAARVASLAQVSNGWRDAVAASLGGSATGFDALAAQDPQAPAVLAYRTALGTFSGKTFEQYRSAVLASETASTGAAASQFGVKSLPMRLALFDQGFQAAELAGAGSFVAQPIWGGNTPVFGYTGSLDMTQSSVITQRGGDIHLVNAGGAINVGLKDSGTAGTGAATGVIALGGGNVTGYAKNDFQVNTQRVFIVGKGDMNIWSSSGDIDSGRGANTAVAAPPLTARRSVDGVVFELPATTSGAGLAILDDATGNRSGTIGLYPAFGEILALDAFIRAPSVILGSTIRGADNLQSPSVGGAAAPVSAPALAVAPPSSTPAENRASSSQTSTRQSEEARQRNSLLTVDLLGLGPAPADEECSEQDRIANKCPKPLQ